MENTQAQAVTARGLFEDRVRILSEKQALEEYNRFLQAVIALVLGDGSVVVSERDIENAPDLRFCENVDGDLVIGTKKCGIRNSEFGIPERRKNKNGKN